MKYWLIPNNPTHYKLEDAFRAIKTVTWSNVRDSKVEVGDIVYMYSSKPDQKIVMRGIITATKVMDPINSDEFAIEPCTNMREAGKVFNITFDKWIDSEELTYANLKELGLLAGPLQTKLEINTNHKDEKKRKRYKELLEFIQNNE